ncbi:MAG: ABC transporter ATP-binding protein, partial [Prevotella sp.]
QRIIIAIALSCNPELIIADEPTTALDVTVQAQIMDLLKKIADERNTAIIMITHNLGVVAKLCDRINIMYAGDIVETGTTDQIFYEPRHWYTRGLLESIGMNIGSGRVKLPSIPGTPPDLLNLNKGCAFMPRCSHAMNICRDYKPAVSQFNATQAARCWDYCKDRADEIVAQQDKEETLQ